MTDPTNRTVRHVEWAKEPHLLEACRKLYIDAGYSASMTAKALRQTGLIVSRNAVIGAMHRHGFRRPPAASPTVFAKPGAPERPKASPKPKSVRMPPMPVFNQRATPLGFVPEATPEAANEPTEGSKTILDIGAHECRWAVSGSGAETLFCAQPTWWKEGEATPWCPTHYRRAYDLSGPLRAPRAYDPTVKHGRPKPDPELRREFVGRAA